MKARASRNRTISLSDAERERYGSHLLTLNGSVKLDAILNRTIHQDMLIALEYLPSHFADLIFVDPPYNLTKQFNGRTFAARSLDSYEEWLESWLPQMTRLLKPNGSLSICAGIGAPLLPSSGLRSVILLSAIALLGSAKRDEGRSPTGRTRRRTFGSVHFQMILCSMLMRFMLSRRVRAPYTDEKNEPKDWQVTDNGRFRRTYPSNLWSDLTVPFWSMPENTDHPTQKPEKLLAKVILASTHADAVVFDPFLGSGTTSVVAKKLGRRYIGIEIDHEYCCLAEKRLALAADDSTIQGYADGVFWERNTLAEQASLNSKQQAMTSSPAQSQLFESKVE